MAVRRTLDFSTDLLFEGGVSSATECPFYKFKPRNRLEAGDCVSRLLTDARFDTLGFLFDARFENLGFFQARRQSGEILRSLIRLGTVVS